MAEIRKTVRKTWICLRVCTAPKAPSDEGAGKNLWFLTGGENTTPQSRCSRDSSPDKGSLRRSRASTGNIYAKWGMKMKIFELNTKLTSYSYPLAKIIISVMIVLFSIFRNNIFTISLKPLSFLVTLICFIATLAAILCTYISIGELFYVRRNKKKQKIK